MDIRANATGIINLEITDFFSDYTSSEVTIRSSQDHQGKAVIELLDSNDIVYTKTKEDVSLTSNTELKFDGFIDTIIVVTHDMDVARQTDRDGIIASDTGGS